MAINKTGFTIKGMTRDTAVSKFSPELAFENQNLRIVATEENTSFGLVNEKGTAATGVFVEGTPIGQEIINDSLVLFTTSRVGSRSVTLNGIEGGTPTLPTLSGVLSIEDSNFYGDHIYKFKINNSNNRLQKIWEYSGDLGFDSGCPIESIGVYENQQIQKVYWTDGINQPRVINITAGDDSAIRNSWNNNSFNFVKVAMYNGSIEIEKNTISFGSFAPGVIQYCFTYYDLYSSETNIFYTSPLYYVSPSTRGGNPEETVSCSFTINIPAAGYNNSFDYLRIYSILRTSIDATPQVRKVADISIKGSQSPIHFTDTGVEGESIDPTSLFYIGGEAIFAGTLAQKDNTLFLGDITVGREPITTDVKAACQSISVYEEGKTLALPDNGDVGYYSYTSQLDKNNEQITYYRRNEVYRLGLQAQHYTGKWSDVVFIEDHTVQRAIANSGSSMSLTNLYATVQRSTTNGAKIINGLVEKGYVKVRPVVVFPDASNRNIICEGVLCPTVFNVEDRYSNGPYAQASWFFRPNAPSTINTSATTGDKSSSYYTSAGLGRWAEFRHNYPIPDNTKPNAEIQCISGSPARPVLSYNNNGYTEPGTGDVWTNENREAFYIDQSVFTMHSPDVEFAPELKTLDSTRLKLRIVGYVPVNASYSDIDIQATAPGNFSSGASYDPTSWGAFDPNIEYKYYPSVASGFFKKRVASSTDKTGYGWRCLLSGTFWYDELYHTIRDNKRHLPAGFVVYPWNRGVLSNASINNDKNISLLQHKKMSIMRFSKNSVMFGSNVWSKTLTGVTKFDSDELTMVKVKAQTNSLSDINYYGNVDKLVAFHQRPKGTINIRDFDTDAWKVFDEFATTDMAAFFSLTPSGYPIAVYDNMRVALDSKPVLEHPEFYNDGSTDDTNEYNNVRANEAGSNSFDTYMPLTKIYTSGSNFYVKRYTYWNTPTIASDPVSIKYKSTPHLVMALPYSSNKQVVLPRHGSVNSVAETYSGTVFWGGSNGVAQDSINMSTSDGYLWLGELYRDDIDPSVRFGGTSEEALENNKWVAAGEPVSLVDANNNAVSSFRLVWSQGDTYYQRYDCLKTFPFTMDDVNSVSDTLSFMCETRVNLDGRYDKNRGQLSNLYASPENVNLINSAYSQRNNFFTYRGVNSKKVNSTFFPNTVTWTKTKTMGETIDTWTAITLASVLDMDGDKGRVRALRRFNNDLLSFQDRAISHILYNESVQISSSSGVPIEIANSGKVSGKRYISNHIGCVNKWSICSAPGGIYFMDDIGKDIFLFNGQLNNISDKYGFHSWVISNFPGIKVWNPRDFSTAGEITYYDKVNGDVLFITGNTALAFSEPLGNFSSFYSYGNTPYFGVLADRGVLWHPDTTIASGSEHYGEYEAWWHREGDYNYFYNVYKPFSITVVANEHPTEDKIFNNLEYRGDTFDVGEHDGEYLYLNTFNRLETWNEYQNGVANLEDVKDNPSNLKKKFRIWRANIPRNTTNKGGSGTVSYRRDRMRNPWLYIKLSKELTAPPVPEDLEEPVITEREINNKKSILHDLVVYYYE